jgi:hypothetical protein
VPRTLTGYHDPDPMLQDCVVSMDHATILSVDSAGSAQAAARHRRKLFAREGCYYGSNHAMTYP